MAKTNAGSGYRPLLFMVYVIVLLSVVLIMLFIAWKSMIWMPGKSFSGTPSPLTEQETLDFETLQQDLTILAQEIGERNISCRYARLVKAAEFIERSLGDSGYEIRRQEITVNEHVVWNIDVEIKGHSHPEHVVVIGAHYDTVPGSPGANDNGSAVVANLALARGLAHHAPARTLRLAFFVNEEMPYYMTDAMGSLRYARQCYANAENVVCMISLETIGCYLDEPFSQQYPIALLRHFYPSTGNFVAVVGDLRSRQLVHRVIRGLRRARFPSEGIAAPRWLKDIFRSDHAAFWQYGYPAVMITDTANFRYPHYHTPQDTVDKINFVTLTRLVTALKESVLDLVGKTN